MFSWMIIRVAASNDTRMWKRDIFRDRRQNETDRVFSSRARSRSSTFPKSTRTGPERTLQLEAARQVDDLRLSRRHDCDHAELDHYGDRSRRIRRSARQ